MNNKTNYGTFYTLRIQDEKYIKDRPGFKIFGVRFAKFLPTEWVHRKACTPPPELLAFCKELEKEKTYSPEKYPNVNISEEAHKYINNNHVWDEFVFKKVYLPNFISHLSTISAKKELAEITSKLEQGQDVYYACYCQDIKICHRRIIAGIIKKQGFQVANFMPNN
jgi:hypothetical protein